MFSLSLVCVLALASVVLWPLCQRESRSMEKLRELGIDPNVPKSECLSALVTQSVEILLDLRTCLFNHADEKSLVTPGDELVSRRLTRSGKPLNEKLSDDIWTLIHCIKGGTMVPRSILKNGKRDRAYLDASRSLTLAAPGPPESRTLTDAPQVTVSDEVRYATMKKELNSLKEEVRSLKKDLSALHRTKNSSRAVSACHIYVRPFLPITSEADLSSIIKCPTLSATKVGFSWKVKIPRDCLYTALSSASPHSHYVRIWKNNAKKQASLHMPQNYYTQSELSDSLNIVAWNCRGIRTSIPYIQHLIASGYDVIILEEHWLWPFELSLLKTIHQDFTYTAVSDSRLNPSSDLTRGCGGVAILWRSSLRASHLFLSDCDRSVAFRLN